MDTLHNIIEYLLQEVPTSTLKPVSKYWAGILVFSSNISLPASYTTGSTPIKDLTSHLQQDLKKLILEVLQLEEKYNITNSHLLQQTQHINRHQRTYPPTFNLSGTLLTLPANRVGQSGDGNWT